MDVAGGYLVRSPVQTSVIISGSQKLDLVHIHIISTCKHIKEIHTDKSHTANVIPAKAFARDHGITGVGLSVRLSVCLLPR